MDVPSPLVAKTGDFAGFRREGAWLSSLDVNQVCTKCPQALREELGPPVQQRGGQSGEAPEGQDPRGHGSHTGSTEVRQVQLSVPAIRPQPGPAQSEMTDSAWGQQRALPLSHKTHSR